MSQNNNRNFNTNRMGENRSCFNQVTGKYLNTFDCILERMIQGMTCAKLTNSISHNFIVQMIPHHRAAIEMSENILQYTTDLDYVPQNADSQSRQRYKLLLLMGDASTPRRCCLIL